MRLDRILRRRRVMAAMAAGEERLRDDLVDFGIELRVVRQSDAGDELVPGCPLLEVVRTHRLGGMVDVRRRRMRHRIDSPEYDGRPQIWYCGEVHEPLVLHGYRGLAGAELPDGLVVSGAEGAAKTWTLAQWLVVRALDCLERGYLEYAPREAGCTAPTGARRTHVLRALKALCPKDWYRWRAKDGEFELALGLTIELQSTHQKSQAEGSRIQGYNWLYAGRDESQDSLHADGDIEARGRSAPEGRYRQLATCTQKDWSKYRTWRDAKKRSVRWRVVRIQGPQSPFVDPVHWERLKDELPDHEYRRRVLAEDVRSPRATYSDWNREIHLRPPDRRALDVTAKVLASYAAFSTRPNARASVLVGHDPGLLFNTSVCLRAYLLRQARKRYLLWRVVGEFVTERTSQDQHAGELKRYLQQTFGCQYDWDKREPDDNLEIAVVFCDPHGSGEKKPSFDEYLSMRKHGIDSFSAEPKLRQIKRRTRIDMIQRLLKAESGLVRLVIDTDEDGAPVAPELVTSLEDAKLDDFGRAEIVKKDETDTTHAGTALGFALWPFEREPITDFTALLGGVS